MARVNQLTSCEVGSCHPAETVDPMTCGTAADDYDDDDDCQWATATSPLRLTLQTKLVFTLVT